MPLYYHGLMGSVSFIGDTYLEYFVTDLIDLDYSEL